MYAAGFSPEAITAYELGSTYAMIPAGRYAYKKWKEKQTNPGPEPYRPTGIPEKKNLTYSQMAPKGAWRTRNFGKQNRVVSKRPVRGRPPYRTTPMYRGVPSYHDPSNDRDNKLVVIKDIREIGPVLSNTMYFGAIGLHDLQSAPIFKKFSIMYGKVRVRKIKVTIMDGQYIDVALTTVSQLDADDPAGKDEMLKEPSLHIHNMSESAARKYPPSRTFDLFKSNKDFTDWTDTTTADLNAELGTGATPGSKKAVIKYGVLQQRLTNGAVFQFKIEYFCEFCSLNDLTTINGITL